MNKLIIPVFLILIASCRPFDIPVDNTVNGTNPLIDVSQKTIDQLDIPNGFTYATVKKTSLTIRALDNQGNPLKEVGFDLYLKNVDDLDSVFLFNARTGDDGTFSENLEVTSEAERFIVISNYIGLPNYNTSVVNFGKNEIVIGGDNTKRTEVVQGLEKDPNNGKSGGTNSSFGTIGGDPIIQGVEGTLSNFSYIGTYDGEGVPRYLTIPGDKVSQDILNMVNASLPEGQPVPKFHPEYITTAAQTQLVLKDSATVWVTFVSEGAGYRNSVGYYSFPTNKPPTSAAGISDLKVIFPNASFVGSGGGLRTGDKVNLGNFPAGTTIGWFLVPDGWNPSRNGVVEKSGYPIRFANRDLNTFTSEAYRSHVAQLYDPNRELVIIGFEDLNRPSGDHDFNDAVIYATVNPFTAVSAKNVVQTTVYGIDSDHDGVPDNQDAAPFDPTYAFIKTTPSVGNFGSLAYEDSYPFKGDYDMNDMVIDYNIEERLNAAQKITAIRATFVLRAMGASNRNGFGFELPIPASNVASASGMKIRDTYINLESNGVEKGHQRAVFIPFDNGFSLMHAPDGGFVNTEKGKTKITPDTIQMLIKFREPVSKIDNWTAPYNPFLIVNRERGREVHLPGKTPTALANLALFGTGDDDTGGGKYYQTKKNLPWGINLPQTFKYPAEKIPINSVYLKFNQWSESAGSSFPNWFKSINGYRDLNKIY